MRESIQHVIAESNVLAKGGENERALELLDVSISEASRKRDAVGLRLLCRHATVICDNLGDLSRLKRYSETLLSCSPNDPFALYSLADVLFRSGELRKAKALARQSYELSAERGTERDSKLLELIVRRWPELRRD